MKILLVHNYYKQRGGEDESFEAEAEMLTSFGHEVRCYTRHNEEIEKASTAKVAMGTIWSRRTYHELKSIISDFRPEVVHCTNLFPLISTAVYYSANACNVPVVQSLRNYRPFCLNSNFFYEGKICERCISKRFALPGIVRGCYKKSRLGSVVVATRNAYHRSFKTWHRRVNCFFTPTDFARRKYVEAGFPESRIRVKPNFLSTDRGYSDEQREFAMFVGRLAPEKGLQTLVSAWSKAKIDVPLKIVGDGELRAFVKRAATEQGTIEFMGQRPLDEVTAMLGRAKFLVMPSEWYETFGRTIMESFSRGTPVIAPQLGAMGELVDHGVTGICYSPGDVEALSRAICQMDSDRESRVRMGEKARKVFVERYTPEGNHDVLLSIYEHAKRDMKNRKSNRIGRGGVGA